jgi:succinate dehydrogenase flavin-adding protein (antitoxin of CptAB toxin-antitoxin module)
MCTVSFVFSNGKAIITHNRDEKVARPSAIEPKNYLVNNKNILFPKDPKAGGTWYAITEDGTILVLLNGADEKHEVKLPYRRSRGLIVLDIISSDSAINEWENIDLDNVEPFTIVLFQDHKLYQLRWNGMQKTVLNLDTTKSHIWSSATLYPKEIRENRSNWFHTFLDTRPEITETEMYNFHRYTENDNQENGLIINRNDSMKTLSITQSVVDQNKVTLVHHDLIANKDFSNTFITV